MKNGLMNKYISGCHGPNCGGGGHGGCQGNNCGGGHGGCSGGNCGKISIYYLGLKNFN